MLDVMSKYGMANCKPILVPLDQNGKVSTDVGVVLGILQCIGRWWVA